VSQYYFALTKTIRGPMNVLSQVPDLDPADSRKAWAGTCSADANLPGYANGTMIFCIAVNPSLDNPAWPGVTAASPGQVTSWLQRTGDPSPENAAGWLGGA
jgi:hypothetical protein